MAEPVKKDDALAIAVREAFHRHMENARLAALVSNPPVGSTDGAAVARAAEAKLKAPEARPAPVAAAPTPPPAPTKASSRSKVAKHAEAKAVEPKAPEPKARDPRLEVPTPANLPAASVAKEEIVVPRKVAATINLPAIAPDQGNHPTRHTPAPPALPAVSSSRELAAPRTREVRTQPTIPQGDRVAEEIIARREAEWLQSRSAERAAVPTTRPIPVERQARELVQRQRDRLPTGPVPEDLDARPLPQSGRGPVGRTRPQSHFGTHKPDDVLPAKGKRLAANGNKSTMFGRSKHQAPSALIRWVAPMAAAFAVVTALGAGSYYWIVNRPASLAVATISNPPAAVATKPAVVSPTLPTPAVATASPPDEATTRNVKTVTITLDEIDMAVQDSREKVAAGDVASARLILEPYRAGGDARALVALAETFDPSVVHNPALADAKQAQQLYEAAGKAGFQGSAERVAKIQQALLAN